MEAPNCKKNDGKDFFSSEPFIGIRRHRLLTDGAGITTLVAFHGCTLSCKYCLNPQCKTTKGIWEYLTPAQLFNRIKIDDIYFQSTGGGIVFGGGEPLLYPHFIKQFSDLCKDKNWNIYIETTLNVKNNILCEIAPIVNEFIVDIKDMNPFIYRSYTGVDNRNVLDNIEYLVSLGMSNKILARIPYIYGYNTEDDVKKSIDKLQKVGLQKFDCFKYIINLDGSKNTDNVQPIGKAICEVLKGVRALIADANNIDYRPDECKHIGNCLGTCPKCDKELELLTEELYDKKSRGSSIKL